MDKKKELFLEIVGEEGARTCHIPEVSFVELRSDPMGGMASVDRSRFTISVRADLLEKASEGQIRKAASKAVRQLQQSIEEKDGDVELDVENDQQSLEEREVAIKQKMMHQKASEKDNADSVGEGSDGKSRKNALDMGRHSEKGASADRVSEAQKNTRDDKDTDRADNTDPNASVTKADNVFGGESGEKIESDHETTTEQNEAPITDNRDRSIDRDPDVTEEGSDEKADVEKVAENRRRIYLKTNQEDISMSMNRGYKKNKCKSCGEEIQPGDRYCEGCQNLREKNANANKKVGNVPNDKTVIKLIIAIVIILIIVGAIAYSLSRVKETEGITIINLSQIKDPQKKAEFDWNIIGQRCQMLGFELGACVDDSTTCRLHHGESVKSNPNPCPKNSKGTETELCCFK